MPLSAQHHVGAATDEVVVPTGGAVTTISDIILEGRNGKSKNLDWGGYIAWKPAGLTILATNLKTIHTALLWNELFIYKESI